MRSRLAAGCAVLALAGVGGPAAAEQQVRHRVACAFTDDRIDESSGLAAGSDVLYTVNDSGDDPVVYVVDKGTCATVAVTAYSDEDVQDVEALAAGDRWLWVGDIGDNDADRSSVAVHRLPLARLGESTVPATRFALAYPDRPQDAEALLVHPVTGRLYVVTKQVFGAGVYAAPDRLRPGRVNRLSRIGTVGGLVTGGAFYPGGDHLVLRSYQYVAVHDFPGLDLVRRVGLPHQEQGEAVAVSPAGEVYLTSEGVGSTVLRIELPSPHPLPAPSPRRSARPAHPPSSADASSAGKSPASWAWLAGCGVAATLALVVAGRRGRSRRASREWPRRRVGRGGS